jgi:hypothetical protein
MAATEWCADKSENGEKPKMWTVDESVAWDDEPEDANGKQDAAKQSGKLQPEKQRRCGRDECDADKLMRCSMLSESATLLSYVYSVRSFRETRVEVA